MRLLVLPVLLALGLAACTPPEASGPGSATPTDPPPGSTVSTVVTVTVDSTYAISDPARRLTASVEYPQLVGDDAAAQALNAAIRDTARAVVQRFSAMAEVPSPGIPNEMGNGSESKTEQFFANERVVSGRIVTLQMFAGAAHPDQPATAFTFDRRTGKAVALADLFAEGAAYLDTLSARSRTLLRRTFAADSIDVVDEMFDEGTAPRAESFRVFTVGADGLHLYFPHYAVGPYAIGAHEAVVPWDVLRPMLRADGVAEGL